MPIPLPASRTRCGRSARRAASRRARSASGSPPSSPDAVFTSPLLRARETATAIARAGGLEPQSDERLAPGASAEDVLAVVEDAGETVVVVGHQPDCSEIAAALGAGEHDFAPAGVRRDRARVTAISVRGLRKSYDGVEAVRGIDFEVAKGEVFGLLGPNGAGKTTTVEILEGYRTRDAGEVEVLGFDPQRVRARVQGADRRRPPGLGAVAGPDACARSTRSSPATTGARATSTR